jgi:hypothetical protein
MVMLMKCELFIETKASLFSKGYQRSFKNEFVGSILETNITTNLITFFYPKYKKINFNVFYHKICN